MICCTALMLSTSSCSVEKLIDAFECDSENLFTEALVERDFYQEALNAYVEDQSAENCNELKTSGSMYVTAVEKYIECSEKGDAEIKRELKEAKKALAEIGC